MSNQTNFPIVSQLLNFHSATITNGGQKANGGGWVSATFVDVEVPLTGEWYWEYITDNYVYAFMGITRLQFGSPHHHNTDFAFVQNGEYRYNGSNQANTSNIGTGDIVGVYVNNGIIKVYVNNSLDHTYTQNLSIVGQPVFPVVFGTSNTTINFGQDSSFLGVKTAQGNTDGNGIGDFYYTPPGNALALCSANTPTSSDIDPAQTDNDYPSKNFNILTYTGNSTTGQSLTGLGFKPDLIWAKMTSSSQNNQLFDSSRLNTRGTPTPFGLRSDTIGAEFDDQTEGNGNPIIASFDTDGFTLGTSGSGPNDNNRTYVAWCWKANGGTTSSNSNGSITSTVQANTKAGFSIATYTSPGSGTNHTVGHGLSGVDFIITKNRSQSFNWYCFHKSSQNYTYRLNDGSRYSYSNWSMGATTWGSQDGYTHNSTDNYVAYCWQNVAGMQKFGSYVGNGSTNGPYIETGFRPRMLFTLLDNSTSGWRVRDTARDTFNPSDSIVWWNLNFQQYNNSSQYPFDILSNGFKLRTGTSDFNGSGSTYLYGAWADVPAKYNNAF